MEYVIIYGHPTKQGHNGAFLEAVTKSLDERKADYKVIDLYKENFDPRLSKEELYTQGGKKISTQIKSYQKLVDDTTKLIFIYPVWWAGAPSIVKGFFDKLLTPRFGYYFKPLAFNQGYPVALFKDKRALVFLTSTSQKVLYSFFSGRRAHKQIKKDLLGFVGIKSKVYHLDMCLKLDDWQRGRINKYVKKGLNWL